MMKEEWLRFFRKPRGISEKTIWVILKKDILFWRKEIFFERVRLKTAKRKIRKPEGEEKNGVSQRDEKRE